MTGTVDLSQLLAFYRDAGVDEALEAAPVDRFAEAAARAAERAEAEAVRATAAPAPRETIAPVAALPRAPAMVPDEAAVAEARKRAAEAETLDALADAIATFDALSLPQTARRMVFGAGPTDASLMVIGDVPDRDEDETGEPFAGIAGKLFDRMLASIGLSREALRLTTALPWRTPGQRVPTPHERACLAPFLARHVELVAPKTVLLMGGTACDLTLSRRLPGARQKWHELKAGSHEARALVTFHPNLLLAQPQQKRLAWRDLLMLKGALERADGHS